jgi:hypothetical protein
VAKELAPHKPHPRGPDEPPANLLAGPAAKAMDAARDTIRRIVPGSSEAG